METAALKCDETLQKIAGYVCRDQRFSDEAYETARHCLADSLGCAILALQYSACTKLLGPVVPGTVVPGGVRVPGTEYTLDPIRGAFNIGTCIRWLDFNDTWLAAEWGHPSDNLGALLAIADYLGHSGQREVTVEQLLHAAIQAHEIQGVLALDNSLNRVGHDHVLFVKVASAAVACRLLGGDLQQVADTLSQAWIDTGPLRTYRHYPNTGSRKSWAAGDATARGVQLAMMTLQGEMGYATALSADKWGFEQVIMGGKPITLQRDLGSYVMENVLFKISFPAEFHAQTAVEAAVRLHALVNGRIDEIDRIQITTHESALRIIDKTGPLTNPADRDHCLQYMTAVGLLKGNLVADDYEDDMAANPQIDQLRQKMVLTEDPRYTKEYLDADKRSIANAVQVFFKDGSSTEKVEVEYPIGHRRRRAEGIPLLYDKFRRNMATGYDGERLAAIEKLFDEPQMLLEMSVTDLMTLLSR